jgi:putative membrane protein
MNDDQRAPRAFRLDEPKLVKAKKPKIEFEPEPAPAELVPAPLANAQKQSRGTPWGKLLLTSLGALVLMYIGLTTTKLVEDFFRWGLTLGWIAVAVASIAGIAFLALVLREIWGLWRLRKIEKVQLAAARAINHDDKAAAKWALSEMATLYTGRPDMAWGLKTWKEHQNDIIDPPDAIRLAERILLEPLDEVAHRIIAKRARRVTLLTTVTPAAALDMILVGAQNLFMIREIAENYGGRPSFIATLRLSRLVITHLAVAGGLALSENFLHLFVGKGLLGRLSARFGEGAINGILTSRIGLAACEVCRPIAKEASKRETLTSLTKELLNFSKEPEVGA